MGELEISGIAVAEVWRKGEQGCGMWKWSSSGPQSAALPLSSPLWQLISSPYCHLK